MKVPRALVILWALAAGIVLAVTIAAAVALWSVVVPRGEPPFTDRDRIWLAENAPGGRYIGQSQYQRCEYGRVVFYGSTGKTWTFGDGCWR